METKPQRAWAIKRPMRMDRVASRWLHLRQGHDHGGLGVSEQPSTCICVNSPDGTRVYISDADCPIHGTKHQQPPAMGKEDRK
jgi:hypothetical protein